MYEYKLIYDLISDEDGRAVITVIITASSSDQLNERDLISVLEEEYEGQVTVVSATFSDDTFTSTLSVNDGGSFWIDDDMMLFAMLTAMGCILGIVVILTVCICIHRRNKSMKTTKSPKTMEMAKQTPQRVLSTTMGSSEDGIDDDERSRNDSDDGMYDDGKLMVTTPSGTPGAIGTPQQKGEDDGADGGGTEGGSDSEEDELDKLYGNDTKHMTDKGTAAKEEDDDSEDSDMYKRTTTKQ